MVETYLLEQLAAVAEYGTISAASEALHISQPSISRSMQKLEGLLGVTLFGRTKNKVELNENGRLAAEYAVRILQLHEDMETGVRALDRSRNTISIGSSAPGPLMELVPMLNQLYPGMTISSELKEEEELVAGFRQNIYQLIVLSHPLEQNETGASPTWESVPCGSEHLHVSLPPAHPAAMYKEVSFKDMDGETFIMNANVGLWDAITRNGMPRSHLILQESTEDLGQLIRSSSLPSFVTDLTLRLYGLDANRIAVPFSDPEAITHYYLTYNKKQEKTFSTLLNRLT